LWIERINLHRVAFWTIRSPRGEVITPLGQTRVVIESRHAIPCHPVIFTLEEPNWTRTTEPNSRLTGVGGRKKEHMVERESLAACVVSTKSGVRVLFFRTKPWRPLGFLPSAPAIRGPIHRRPQMSGAHRRQEGAAAARVLYDVVDLRAKEPWLAQPL